MESYFELYGNHVPTKNWDATFSNRIASELEYMSGEGTDIFLNLKSFAVDERAEAWAAWVPRAWPGLRVAKTEGTPSGLVHLLRFDQARFWSLIATSHTVVSDPDRERQADDTLAIIHVRKGVLEISHGEQKIQLGAGDITVLRRSKEFRMEHIGLTRSLVCEIPTPFVEARHSALFQMVGAKIEASNGISQMLHQLSDSILRNHRSFAPEESAAVLTAFLTLADGLSCSHDHVPSQSDWRVRRALQDIDRAIEDPDLSAQSVARLQHISRRRLDQLIAKEISSTLSAQILERRLLHAACSLRDPRQSNCLITEIAFAAGFKDSAHFSRTFRDRFKMSPRDWRRLGASHVDAPGRD